MRRAPKITADEIQTEYLKQMFAGENEKIIDESALSVSEIADRRGYSLPHAGRIAHKKAATGEWEMVWKRGARCLIPAYRPKR